jgi:hypothetical protein
MMCFSCRAAVVAAVLGAGLIARESVARAADGGDAASTTQPAGQSLPWAVRRGGDQELLIVQNSSTAVPIPHGMLPGDVNGNGSFGPADMSYYVQFSSTPGEKADEQSATAAAGAVASELGGTIVDQSLVVDRDSPFPAQVHFVVDSMHHQIPVVLRQRVVDGQVVTAVLLPHPDSPLPASASDVAIAALNGAQTVERKPVRGHEEVGNFPGMAEHATPRHADRAGGPGSEGEPGAMPGRPAPGGMGQSSSASSGSVSGSAQRETWAAAALAAAKKLAAAGNDPAAYERYQYILREYPKSASARDAQDAVTAYEANPDLMAKIHPKTGAATQPTAAAPADPAARAAGLLSLGENYLSVGQNDLARAKFSAVVQQFPDSPGAAAAKQHLTDMDNAGK